VPIRIYIVCVSTQKWKRDREILNVRVRERGERGERQIDKERKGRGWGGGGKGEKYSGEKSLRVEARDHNYGFDI
jgi:hypothetical protein